MTSSSSMRRALSRPRKMRRPTARGLEECIEALTADDPEIRARAADALLDVPAGGASSGQRGAPWAYAVVAAGAVIPLLALVQRVRRDARDGLKPKPADVCPENTDAVVAGGDAALLVLAEVANAAASFLQEEGWEVAYDEDTERPIFVDEVGHVAGRAARAGARAGRLGGGRHGRGADADPAAGRRRAHERTAMARARRAPRLRGARSAKRPRFA